MMFSSASKHSLPGASPAAAVLAQTPGLRPVTEIESWPLSWGARLLPWLAGAALAALIIWGLRRYLRRRKPGRAAALPAAPPHETAFRALRTLLGKGWMEAGEAEPFYVELSDIVRRYLEDRFQLRAPEWTTEEFLRATAVSTQLQPGQRQRTADFLMQSDMVKFARHRPDAATMRAAYESAWRLVEETRPGEDAGEGGMAS